MNRNWIFLWIDCDSFIISLPIIVQNTSRHFGIIISSLPERKTRRNIPFLSPWLCSEHIFCLLLCATITFTTLTTKKNEQKKKLGKLFLQISYLFISEAVELHTSGEFISFNWRQKRIIKLQHFWLQKTSCWFSHPVPIKFLSLYIYPWQEFWHDSMRNTSFIRAFYKFQYEM